MYLQGKHKIQSATAELQSLSCQPIVAATMSNHLASAQ